MLQIRVVDEVVAWFRKAIDRLLSFHLHLRNCKIMHSTWFWAQRLGFRRIVVLDAAPCVPVAGASVASGTVTATGCGIVVGWLAIIAN